MNFLKYLRALFYRTPQEAASPQSTLKKIKNILTVFSLHHFAIHNRKLSQDMCLYSMSIVREYAQGALRKRELLCSFVGYYDGKSRKKM